MSKIISIFLALVITNIFSFSQDYYQLMMINNNEYLNSYIVTTNYQIGIDNEDNSTWSIISPTNSITISATKLTAQEFEEKLYLVKYLNNEVVVTIYDLTLERLETQTLYTGEVFGELFSTKNSQMTVFTWTGWVNENKNIIGYSFGERDNQFSFGGSLDDEVKGLKCSDDSIYLVCYKDSLSGGDFGYSGHGKALVLAKINSLFEVDDYITLDLNEEVKKLEVVNDYLYLFIGTKVYLFTSTLKLCNTFDLGNYIYAKVGENNIIFTTYTDKIVLYDSYDFTIKKEINESVYGDSGVTYELKEFEFFLYYNKDTFGYVMDIVSLEGINSYYNEEDELVGNYDVVTSLFGKCILDAESYVEYFDGHTFGDYDLELEYKTPSGYAFLVNRQEEIALRVNVEKDMIYKSGYRLLFNGVATLDGVSIVNNYPVTEEGNHTLVIKGNGKEEVIQFKVSNNQVEFSDSIKENSDYEIMVNNNLTLNYKCSGLATEDIERIVTRNCEVLNYAINNGELSLVIKGFSTVSEEKIFIEKIEYKKYLDKDKTIYILDEVYLNKEYTCHVYSNYPTISLSEMTDDLIFQFEVIDDFKALRALEVELISEANNYNYVFNYSLENSSLNISGINKGLYQCYIRLNVNIGKDEYQTMELYQCELEVTSSTFTLGELVINKYTDTINKFTVSLSKEVKNTMLTKLNVNNNEIVITDSSILKNRTMLIYAALAFIGLLVIGLGIKCWWLKHKNNDDVSKA